MIAANGPHQEGQAMRTCSTNETTQKDAHMRGLGGTNSGKELSRYFDGNYHWKQC